MVNNIEELLEDIGSETPKINPYLGNKIYNKAKEKESKKNIPFFKKPLVISLSSILAAFILLIIVLVPGKSNDNKTDSPLQGGGEMVVNPFVPNLSPNTQSAVFIEYNYTIYSNDYDIVTLIVNNKINYKRIYLKAYNLTIDDIKVNNGDVIINQVTIDGQKFFELVFDNTDTKIHYLDLCFKKGSVENVLASQSDYMLKFIMYIDEVDVEKGYGYEVKPDSIFDIRNGINL